ncbi:hypothetical protein thalar_03158 [Litoreibacter arenae DSM 19593]|uniref:Uncharacterized protein n=1 Tax=Litoreibacter arenae DSM 19593 TaxID=1123360 RepID=S9RH68_9RHOB|nr:hypothetical protein thalar_03158 [Litoreibacter arenae DSM 19593]
MSDNRNIAKVHQGSLVRSVCARPNALRAQRLVKRRMAGWWGRVKVRDWCFKWSGEQALTT